MPPNNAMKGMTRRNFGRYTLAAGGALMMAGCDLRLSGRFTSADTHVRDYPTVQAVNILVNCSVSAQMDVWA
jgi:hypothetical protein